MQLIRITSIPMKCEFEVEPARLQVQRAQNPRQQVTVTPSRLALSSNDIQVRLDTTDLRASLNQRNSADFATYTADLGRQAASMAIDDAVQEGSEMQRIEDGVSIAQIIQQKMMDQPDSAMVFLPTAGPDISWEPGNLSTDYQPASVETDWQIMKNQMEYIPGKFHMKILQYPDVKVEYLGGPNYVPPSADPEYTETSA